VKATLKQHVRPGNLPALLKAASHILRAMDTDITKSQAASLLPVLAGMSQSDIMTITLHTHHAPSHGVYYSRAGEEDVAQAMGKVDDFLGSQGTRTKPLKECAVAVLNGSGKVGVARSAGDRVRRAGAELTSLGNAPRFAHATTEIRYRPEARDAAEELRDVLDVPRAVLRRDEELEAPGAASILATIGKDYRP